MTTTEALLLNRRDAAKLLSVSERTVWALTASGDLPAVRIGRSVRYARADVEAYVKEQRERGSTR